MANGNTPVYSGLGARRGISAAGESYLKTIKEAGETISGLGAGLAKAQMEIGRREAVAESIIPEAKFSEDQGTKSSFSGSAEKIKARIGGEGEDAYDFSNLADMERFKKDVESLTTEISSAEPLYNQLIENLKKLEEEHALYVKLGEDPNQAPVYDVGGGIQAYNAKAATDKYVETIKEVQFLRDSKLEETPEGKWVIKDDEGNVVREFKSRTAYYEKMIELSKPELQPVPVVSPTKTVEDGRFIATHPTLDGATKRFNTYVQDNDMLVRRWYAEQYEIPLKDVDLDVGSDGLTLYQREYRDAMIEAWKAQERPATQTEFDKASQKAAAKDKEARQTLYNSVTIIETPITEIPDSGEAVGPQMPTPTGEVIREVVIPLSGIQGNMNVTVDGDQGQFRPQSIRFKDGIINVEGAFFIDRIQQGQSAINVESRTISLDPNNPDDASAIQQLEKLGLDELNGVSLKQIMNNPESLGIGVKTMSPEVRGGETMFNGGTQPAAKQARKLNGKQAEAE